MALLGPGESQAGVAYNPPIIARSPWGLAGGLWFFLALGTCIPYRKAGVALEKLLRRELCLRQLHGKIDIKEPRIEGRVGRPSSGGTHL